MKIISFGEVLWDVYPHEKFIGGAPLNFAAHLARLGEEVLLLSAVGNDELGRLALRQLKTWGISDRLISVLPEKETGKCMVTLDSAGVPAYHLLDDMAYDAIPYPGKEDADVLYFGTLALRSDRNFHTLQKLLAENKYGEVFVDINLRKPFYTPESVAFAASHATILKISLEELPEAAAMLSVTPSKPGEFAARLAALYPQLTRILISLGADGAFVYDADSDKSYTCPGKRVTVCSTVGAGDSFSAGFLHHFLAEKTVGECLDFATRLAAFVVSKPGAVPDYRPDEIK